MSKNTKGRGVCTHRLVCSNFVENLCRSLRFKTVSPSCFVHKPNWSKGIRNLENKNIASYHGRSWDIMTMI
jgi:hypothetical protein